MILVNALVFLVCLACVLLGALLCYMALVVNLTRRR